MVELRAIGWRLANRLGPSGLRAWSQNDQYRRGRWRHLGHDRRPVVAELVADLAANGAVVELGCGEGHLVRSIDPGCYRSYLGLDISAVAVAAAERHPPPRCSFEVGDIGQWPGAEGIQLIVAEESLYYLRSRARRALLERCRTSLAQSGAMLVTVADRDHHRDTVDDCRAVFPTRSEIPAGSGGLVLVLRRSPAGAASLDTPPGSSWSRFRRRSLPAPSRSPR